ncbi:phosphatidylinositol-specific phospholipase C1-like protein [Microbacterium pseudoresistens]|uniref:Phosphatidylinositol diacylglycerol-lyase n=1 Tax=Microbacterium pseudoresistens TaxID=640634 RepID=A0A7Y9EUT2_9MICO|nr:Ca2+-dependent phosphoinositide-specific phospholipase C [Microbacterium pseudoresistens]NYD53465.1 hypothetical protein [Microbacterium pseudoresistens]
MPDTVVRRRWPRIILTVLLAVVVLAGVLVATVFINGAIVMNNALGAQKEHLAALQEQVADQPDGVFADWRETPIADETPWSDVQSIATHNSYAIAPDLIQNAVLQIARPGEPAKLAYSHDPLWDQLDQGVRSVELDLRVHDDGALRLTHVPVLANASNAPDFRLALEEIALWSDSHPGHLPITILVEFKSDYAFLDPTLTEWDDDGLGLVDDAIQENLGDALFSPAELDGNDWPVVGDLRDRVMVIMHPGPLAPVYGTSGEVDRTMFLASQDTAKAGMPFVVHNAPDPRTIMQLRQGGLIVRTRADADLSTDPAERDRALASGAQVISTDFPAPKEQSDTGYTVSFPDGDLNRVIPGG